MFAIGELRGELIKSATCPNIRNSIRWYPYLNVSSNHVFSSQHTTMLVRNRIVCSPPERIVLASSMILMTTRVMKSQYATYTWEGSTIPVRICLLLLLRSQVHTYAIWLGRINTLCKHSYWQHVILSWCVKHPWCKFYLGDDEYECRVRVLPPFWKTRYHLNKSTSRNNICKMTRNCSISNTVFL